MPINSEVTSAIRKYALKNAVDYGKAHEGSVLNKIISLYPEHKSDIKALAKEVNKIITEVNSLEKSRLEEEYAKYVSEFESEQKIKVEKTAKPNMELDGAVPGNFATRYPPAPNGYMHIGHAKAVFLESEFAQKYNGKLFLYFDDTNPEKDRQEFVDKFHDVLTWLGVKFDKEYYASDYMDKIYECTMTLLKNGDAYACKCSPEQIKDDRFNKRDCAHRNSDPKSNINEFEGMLSGKYGESEAIIRFMGDMASDNTVLRDPTLLRIKDAEHYRQGKKYRVWPTYDLNTPIMDSIHGVTDVLRSKEFELRDDLGKMILTKLGLRVPRIHSFSRLVIKDNITHKRELNELIKEGSIKGFDDPRLVTIVALRKRGILPEAIKNFVLKLGMTKTDSIVNIDVLLAENKKIIDPMSKHLFFVSDPIKVTVKGASSADIKIKLHPSNDLGFREYTVNDTFYIAKEDGQNIAPGEVIRLKDLMDIKITSNDGKSVIAEKSEGSSKNKVIQWVPGTSHTECTVLIPENPVNGKDEFNPNSLKIVKGFAEGYINQLKEHEIIQFERFGYCILDKKEQNKFIFISK